MRKCEELSCENVYYVVLKSLHIIYFPLSHIISHMHTHNQRKSTKIFSLKMKIFSYTTFINLLYNIFTQTTSLILHLIMTRQILFCISGKNLHIFTLRIIFYSSKQKNLLTRKKKFKQNHSHSWNRTNLLSNFSCQNYSICYKNYVQIIKIINVKFRKHFIKQCLICIINITSLFNISTIMD